MAALTETDLLAFEADIEAEFAAGKIKAPIHLSGGNETQLINIFKGIDPEDWILCGWRSHYHCLLKGVPPEEVKAAILAGRSVALCFPEHNVLSSGIVGGAAPIAVGIAWALAQRASDRRVYCFLGDMAAETGIVHEAMKYAHGHGLPVTWIIENNGTSVCTDTAESWGATTAAPDTLGDVIAYDYKLTRPHAGIGRWVKF